MSESPGGPTGGVIHDIGYRRYDGARDGAPALARTLYVTGLRHAFGLGRSPRSRILPFVLLGLSTLPAVIVVGVLAVFGTPELPLTYADYTNQTGILVTLFAAAQAPVLFSRDLRHRSIVLYLARPLPAAAFALVRWLSLATAILAFLLLPVLVLYAGALLSGLDVTDETGGLLKAVTLQVLLAAMLAGVTGLVSSVSLRRGFAVVGSILVLAVGGGVVSVVQAIAREEGATTVGVAAGLGSPQVLVTGLGHAWGVTGDAITAPTGAGWVAAYVAAGLLLAAACVALLVLRFRTVGSR